MNKLRIRHTFFPSWTNNNVDLTYEYETGAVSKGHFHFHRDCMLEGMAVVGTMQTMYRKMGFEVTFESEELEDGE